MLCFLFSIIIFFPVTFSQIRLSWFWWNFQILFITKFVRKLHVVFLGRHFQSWELKMKCFCMLTIFLKKYQRSNVQTFSDGGGSSAAVPFTYPNVRCHYRSSPERNKKKIFPFFKKNIFLLFFERDAQINTEYIICFKIGPRILEILWFKILKRESV